MKFEFVLGQPEGSKISLLLTDVFATCGGVPVIVAYGLVIPQSSTAANIYYQA